MTDLHQLKVDTRPRELKGYPPEPREPSYASKVERTQGKRTRLRFLAAMTGLLAIMSCGTAADEQTDQQPEDLWGRTFVSVKVTEGDEPRPLVSHDPIEVTFERREPRGVVRWEASCNILGAGVEITTSRLFLKQMAGTDIGCPDEHQEQDEWLATFFGSDPHWALNADRLTLASGDTVIQLEASRE